MYLRIARALSFVFAAAALVLGSPRLAAAGFPERPITLVVANPAGGATDELAREVADALQKRLKQPLVVLNLSGGSGAIAAKHVLRAAPDGYTLWLGTAGDIVVTPMTNAAAAYAPANFTPIAMIGSTALALVASPAINVRNIDELVARAKDSRPLTLGFTGAASLQAFAAAAFTNAAGIQCVFVPYRGGAALITDLIGHQIDLGITALPGVMDVTRSGELTMLGILSERRSAVAPHIPTVNESPAVKGIAIEIWAGLVGPPNLPSPIVDTINRAVQDVLGDGEFRERRGQAGDIVAAPASAEAFSHLLAQEQEHYRLLRNQLGNR